MNPVTLPPPAGSTRCPSVANRDGGKIQLSEYGDDVYRLNRREDMMLSKRLLVLDRQRADSSAAMRKSFQTAEKLVSTLQADLRLAQRQTATLEQYDNWRTMTRYNYGNQVGDSRPETGPITASTDSPRDVRTGVVSRKTTPYIYASPVPSRNVIKPETGAVMDSIESPRGVRKGFSSRKLTPYVSSPQTRYASKSNASSRMSTIGELETVDDESPRRGEVGQPVDSVKINVTSRPAGPRRHTIAFPSQSSPLSPANRMSIS